MRLRVVMLFLAVVVLQPELGNVQACGDKFLMIGRGAKFRHAYAAIYPASVVVLALPQRDSAKAMQDPRFLSDLKQAGHRVSLLEDERALTHILASDKVDILLADASDADRVAALAATASTRPNVLPVMSKPSKEQIKAIEARFNYDLRSGDRSIKYLTAIEEVMKARKKKA